MIVDNPNPSYIVDLLRDAPEQVRKEGYHPVVEPADANLSVPAGLIAAAHKFGLSVPQDLSISGFR